MNSKQIVRELLTYFQIGFTFVHIHIGM